MDLITYALAKKHGGGSITYTLTADTENKTIVLTPSDGTAQVITVPYATDASTVNGHEVPELENGKIPANYLPSFVDNVDEYDNISLFPVIGESNRIYIDKSTNKTYRWSGTAYVEISESIALGETSSTAYRGDRGKIAYDHSQSAHAPSNAEANQNAFSNVKIDSDIINANTKTDTLEFIAGDNIILTPNVSNKKITVSQVPVRKTASGNIASFSDGTGDPFLEVKANINPVQDLHGYDNPWVGGAGKNLLKNEYKGTAFASVGDDGSITLNGTVSGLDWLRINDNVTLKAGTYTLSGTPLNPPFGLYIYDDESFGFERIWADFEGRGVTKTIPEDKTGKILLRVPAGTYNNLKIYPMLESGSSKTSFAPYSNICPISGHTEADVNVTGVNIWDEEWESGYYFSNSSGKITKGSSATTIRSKNPILIKSNKSYHIVGSIYRYFFVDNDNNVLSYGNSVDFTTPSNASFLYFYCENTTTYNNDISINYPSTDTTYHAYNGSTLSIPFHDSSDNPITVYGGMLNVTSGELRVTHANIASYNGETINEPWISSMDVYSAGATPTTGAQVVYPLTTPQTYQLTPAQVSTLLNQNNIFADCGQIEVAYKTPFYTDLTTKNEVQVLINESITSALNASY